MLVDVHTHFWSYQDHFDGNFICDLERAYSKNIHVDPHAFLEAMKPCDRVICFGLRGRLTGARVPNEHIASLVAKSNKLIGFMSIDPAEGLDEFEKGLALGLKGVKLGPIYAGFDPTTLDDLYSRCVRHNLPVLIHVGTSFVREGPLEYSRPYLIDAVARNFPDLKIVMAHMGHPWEGETIAVIRKQPNVYADISALYWRPKQFENSMGLAREYGVTHKLLFGSDYPFGTPADMIEAVRRVGLEELLHRDSLDLLWGGQP
jgi:hypothetical protein